MRLAALDGGQRGGARLFVRLLDKVSGRAPDVIKTLTYRPDFFGRPASRAFQRVMRGPSPWSVPERELFAAYTSRLNQCPF
jgi:hypothetical protein